MRRPRRALDGLLLLDKPTGMTSNAALQRVKWLFQARKAGHTGSLDPLASGMLPICFGEATKFAGYLLDADKTYRVQARFGIRTDTGDSEGRPVETHGRPPIGVVELEAAMAALTGPVQQVPPMYSALKQHGQRLYAIARAGREVPRAPRAVWIREFILEAYDPVTPVFRVRCSKGTYIRTLIEDVARHLGTLAHVVALRRLAVEPFGGQAMVTLPEIEACAAGPAGEALAALDGLLQPLQDALPGWPVVCLDGPSALRVSRGGPVPAPAGQAPGPVRLCGPGDSFLGVGEVGADGILRPRRLVARDPHEIPAEWATGL
ncbi:MAG: tRNA pseudouridine(55) synthase TruB [Chromatiales bacterium]|nr:tRNA pseudouridine(55) synthase TruB [Chromatiales bacterium]